MLLPAGQCRGRRATPRKKKLHWQTTLGRLEITERILRRNATGALVRPFCEAHAIQCRGHSLRLQRVMSDFGAEHSFAEAAARIREHYGIELAVGAIDRITQAHAQAAAPFLQASGAGAPAAAEGCKAAVEQLICEMDGSMIPIVEVEKPSPEADGRKHRRSAWKEARLCAAVAQGSRTPTYAVSCEGTAHAGNALHGAACAAGLGEETKVHAVGDGAPWIAAEIDHQFGTQATYLIDFYHVSEYLAAAAPRACPADPDLWRHNQQEALKANRLEAVLGELRAIPARGESAPPEDDPVAICIRYLEKRRSHLDYRAALEAELPIGSGLIESGHRHILQARLKLPGAWWRWDHAKAMASLRVLRQNGLWDSYWKRRAAA